MTSGFGALLRELRRQAGMTQDELAERSGIAVRTIGRLERGEGSNPRLGTVKLLADALGIAPADHRRLLAAAAGGDLAAAAGGDLAGAPGGDLAGAAGGDLAAAAGGDLAGAAG
ncbi:helix-turn-helix transcriptional regulator, partial [Amycolatopsis kentuckyensis]|uniref:helix-turn-helix transcriptional regulator n=1 Tax=Amycolatopsis kentuckyensis TaxID=218823 RepID=UPI0011788FE8